MAFETTDAKQASIQRAVTLRHELRQIYTVGKAVQQKLADYQAGDAALTATVNALFSAAERQEINVMLTQINALVTDWQTNHPEALGLA